MTSVASFTFSDFAENTYVLYDETLECVIIDPGCFDAEERRELAGFIKDKGLRPVRHLLTHAHLDHIFGCAFVHSTYGLLPEVHQGELQIMEAAPSIARMYNIQMKAAPTPARFIEPGEVITFGNSRLETLFVPGHSPASIAFYCRQEGFLVSGDVLFYSSIGRTDLPGGDYSTLVESIRREFWPLPDATIVYSGHGAATTIGRERQYNPFVGEK